VLGLVLSPVAFGAMIDSPRKQMAMGTPSEDVVCKEGMALMKRSSGTSACVKPSTAMKLEKAGWGMMLKDVAMMDKHREKMMEQKEMMMEDKDMMDDKDMMEEKSMMSIGGIDISMAAPVEGSPDAPITIIEFGDYQCPKCDQWFLNEKPIVTTDLLDTGKAKLYFLDFTFLGDDSISAAQAAYCSGDQDMYQEYHSILYTNQGGINEGWASPAELKNFASEVGLDTTAFNECLDSGKYADRVSYNTEVGASLGVEGTPSFFIVASDGSVERIDGPQSASIFESTVNDLS